VFTEKKRAKRLESYKYIPFDEDESQRPAVHGFARDDQRARIDKKTNPAR
jgi:hypothetical protein